MPLSMQMLVVLMEDVDIGIVHVDVHIYTYTNYTCVYIQIIIYKYIIYIALRSLFRSLTCDFSCTLREEQVMSKLQDMEESFQRQMETSQEAIAQRWGDVYER